MLAAHQLLWEYVGARAYSLLTRRAASQLPAIAFSFDIDGVLVRGGEVLAPARRALRRLYSQDGEPMQPPPAPSCLLPLPALGRRHKRWRCGGDQARSRGIRPAS